MPTLILTPRFTEDAQALWRAATTMGWGVERVVGWRVTDAMKAVDEPVLYVEGLFSQTLAAEFGVTLPEPPDDWLPRLPEEYRKRSVELSTLGEARRRAGRAFIKPPNEKSFPAKVYAGDELPREYPDAMPVLVAEIVSWEKEFRCFILDRTIATVSIYLRRGELQRARGFAQSTQEVAEATAFLETVLRDPRVDLPRAAVVDVGVIEGRGWAVIEQNAAWGAGIYGCDPVAVLHVLRAASDHGHQ
jgi:hypothetical protein